MRSLYGHIPDRAGVYAITNIVTGKKYIGSAINLRKRWIAHLAALRTGQGNIKLQRSFDKHGPEAFEFSPILFCDRSMCLFYEELAIAAFDGVDNGYNARRIPSSNLGLKLPKSEETRRKIGAANAIALRGKPGPMRGKKHSDDSRKRMSATKRGLFKQYEFGGKRMCLTAWAEYLCIPLRALQNRIARGWPIERALSEPSRGY